MIVLTFIYEDCWLFFHMIVNFCLGWELTFFWDESWLLFGMRVDFHIVYTPRNRERSFLLISCGRHLSWRRIEEWQRKILRNWAFQLLYAEFSISLLAHPGSWSWGFRVLGDWRQGIWRGGWGDLNIVVIDERIPSSQRVSDLFR